MLLFLGRTAPLLQLDLHRLPNSALGRRQIKHDRQLGGLGTTLIHAASDASITVPSSKSEREICGVADGASITVTLGIVLGGDAARTMLPKHPSSLTCRWPRLFCWFRRGLTVSTYRAAYIIVITRNFKDENDCAQRLRRERGGIMDIQRQTVEYHELTAGYQVFLSSYSATKKRNITQSSAIPFPAGRSLNARDSAEVFLCQSDQSNCCQNRGILNGRPSHATGAQETAGQHRSSSQIVAVQLPTIQAMA